MRKTDIIGSVEVPESWYDLINVIMIRIHDEMESTDETLNILRTVCSGLLSKQEKLDTLKRHGVKVTNSIEKEVNDMSALRNSLEEKYRVQWTAEGEARGEAKGEANVIISAVQNLIKNAGCSSTEEACRQLGFTMQMYNAAKALLAKK